MIDGRMLQEGVATTNSSVGGMLLFTSIVYFVFFASLSATCLFSRSGGFFYSRPEPLASVSHEPSVVDSKVAFLNEAWKKAFARKVYAIVGFQIFTTVLISSVMMLAGGQDLVIWVLTKGYWTVWTSFIGSIASLLGLMCYRQSSPTNLVLLSVFTVLESLLVGFTCASYAAAGQGALVLEAFAITSVIFVGLTLFTMQSKIDFDFLGPFLFVGMLTLLVWGLFSMVFFESFMFQQVYVIGGCLLFSLYVVYDTHLIMNRLNFDEYIAGAISLYLDFINLFLFILRLLSGGRD